MVTSFLVLISVWIYKHLEAAYRSSDLQNWIPLIPLFASIISVKMSSSLKSIVKMQLWFKCLCL